MKQGKLVAAAIAALIPAAVQAERLDLDHRVYAPLHAAMEHPHDGTVYYQAGPSGRILDRILIVGRSAETDWSEALELIVSPRKSAPKTLRAWFAAFNPSGETACPARIALLGQDEASLTFRLDAPACPAGPPLTGVYRVIYGRKTVYLVGAKLKGTASDDLTRQWLTLLGTAKLAG